MLGLLHPLAMRALLGAVAADRHAAPAPRMTTGVIGEHQRAGRPFAGFHVREILITDEFRELLADRQ